MASGKSGKRPLLSTACLFVSCAIFAPASIAAENVGLWQVYETALKSANYVDLTHTITPRIPVWVGFAKSTFSPAKAGADLKGFARKGEVYTYQKHGFEATEYTLRTDQLGTQLDPPAHWAPEYPTIDELPASYAMRPLVVISIVEQVKSNPNYALQVTDIEAWENKHGRIPEGSVVFVRSDWSKAWPDPKLATLKEFPGVGLEALKFLHLQRRLLVALWLLTFGNDHTCLTSRISMASTRGSLRQRLALRSASAQLATHSAWLQAGTPLGQNLPGGCAAKWITTQCE